MCPYELLAELGLRQHAKRSRRFSVDMHGPHMHVMVALQFYVLQHE